MKSMSIFVSVIISTYNWPEALGAVLLAALPEVLRYVAGPLQAMTDGRLDAAILRQLLIALAMVTIMLWRPRGLWPTPEHGKNLNPQGGAR